MNLYMLAIPFWIEGVGNALVDIEPYASHEDAAKAKAGKPVPSQWGIYPMPVQGTIMVHAVCSHATCGCDTGVHGITTVHTDNQAAQAALAEIRIKRPNTAYEVQTAPLSG